MKILHLLQPRFIHSGHRRSQVLCSRTDSSPLGGRIGALALAVAVLGFPFTLRAGIIYVPNFSFESPVIGTNSPYAAPVLDSWQLSPQPGWYDPADFGDSPWADLAGTFYNRPNYTNSQGTNTTFIFNCDGIQAAFMFGLPQLAISQDLSAKFNAGKTYTLTVGLIGGGGGMPLGSTLQLSLYYRDASSNMVIVAQTTVTNTAANFSSNTNFVDFQVQVPGIRPTDLWAGQNIGIQLLATPDPYNQYAWGGYWDVDKVRLVEGIYVPNFSFESPVIGTNSPYAAPVLDSWQLSPQPGWYDPADFGDSPWAYLAGTFYNRPNYTNSQGTNTTFIFNCDGVQAAFMFGLPQLAISQDLSAKFNAGKTCTLTVGLIGGGGGMPLGSTLQLSLYYRDASSNMVIVAQTTVTNTAANFSSNTNFVDFQVQVPGIRPTDLWAGQNIGIQLLATPDPYNQYAWGGYWDVDKVRLVEGVALNLLAPAVTNGRMQFTVQSEPGVACQIFATTYLDLPMASWTSLGTVTNVTGNLPFMDQQSGLQQRFYTARPLP